MSDFREDMAEELRRAEKKHGPPLHSYHEAYAVIAEELDEFWDQTRKQVGERDPVRARKELVQIAAMAWRAARDLGMEAG